MQCSVSVLRCLAGAILLATCGCGDDGNALPEGKTGAVSGTVTYKTAPVPEGTVVVFMKDAGGYTATGKTDAAGNYQLLMRSAPHVLVGTYNVGVTPPLPDMGLSDDEIMKRGMEGTLPEQPKSVIPERYLSAETSQLSFEVKEGENAINIELVD
ncbi:MAG: carboxypeptidase-like regulatory domain-containing protein [Planctomycetota bacterium]|nr:carboxypeptidase-like regulatory domain-containing protein [Planctomycetota bacterium]